MKKFYVAILMALVSVNTANAQTVLYSEDYQSEECTQENSANYWTRSPRDKAPLTLVEDEETSNKYWESVMTNGKNRYLYTRWTTDADAFYGDYKQYKLEFDAALQKGNIATWQELSIISELSVWPFNDNRSNEGIFYTKNFEDGGTLFDLIGDESGKNQTQDAVAPLDNKYYINNNLEDQIELPMAKWCHFSFDIDADALNMHVKIVNSETSEVVLDRDFEIDDAITGLKPMGIYMNNTKNNGTFRIDNIKVTAGSGSATGITNIDNGNMPADATYYNLQGMKVSKPTASGVYVHGGKKVVIK